MWLLSLLLIKIAPVWYHTTTTVTNTQIMRNLNEIMVEVRLQHHVSEWQQIFVKSCKTLVDSHKEKTITKALFHEKKKDLLKATFRSINGVYQQAFCDANRVLNVRFRKLGQFHSNMLLRRVNRFYHWHELKLINRSRDQLFPFLNAMKRSGSTALIDNGDLARMLNTRDASNSFAIEGSLDNIADLLASTDSSDLSNIKLSELCNPNLMDLVCLVNEIMATIPGMIG